MFKKPLAQFMSRPRPTFEPLIRNGHVNVGTIGIGLREELIQETMWTPDQFETDNKVLNALNAAIIRASVVRDIHNTIYPQDMMVGKPAEHKSFDQVTFTDLINQWRAFADREEPTCTVPDNMRALFIKQGMTDDQIDRMVIYPNRCTLDGGNAEIVYKMKAAANGLS